MSIPNSGDSPCEGPELREVQNLKKTKKKSHMPDVQSSSRDRKMSLEQ